MVDINLPRPEHWNNPDCYLDFDQALAKFSSMPTSDNLSKVSFTTLDQNGVVISNEELNIGNITMMRPYCIKYYKYQDDFWFYKIGLWNYYTYYNNQFYHIQNYQNDMSYIIQKFYQQIYDMPTWALLQFIQNKRGWFTKKADA